MKLVERMPRVCKAVNKAKCGKIYLDLFNTFRVTTWGYMMCYFIVLMSSLGFYSGENSPNKEKPFE
jgi:hypothetical protein